MNQRLTHDIGSIVVNKIVTKTSDIINKVFVIAILVLIHLMRWAYDISIYVIASGLFNLCCINRNIFVYNMHLTLIFNISVYYVKKLNNKYSYRRKK